MPKIDNLDEAAAAVLDAQQQKHRLELRGLGTKVFTRPAYLHTSRRLILVH